MADLRTTDRAADHPGRRHDSRRRVRQLVALELHDPLLRDRMVEGSDYANAACWIYSRGLESGAWAADAPISLTDVRHVHELVLGLMWDIPPHSLTCGCGKPDPPGTFREHDVVVLDPWWDIPPHSATCGCGKPALCEHDTEPFPTGTRTPPWPQVPMLMHHWIGQAQQLYKAGPTGFTEALARLHANFLAIHPFLDGNGRTGRLVLNLLLVRLGYPPAIIYESERMKYINALLRAQQDERGLGEFLAGAMLRSSALVDPARSASPSRTAGG